MSNDKECIGCLNKGTVEPCGYCGFDYCDECFDLHEQDCDRNPENEEA